ncbi:hypothetical protein ACGFMM_24165 [Streptomyces sp. NPDC048604]|uniref:hypothetical protein n=1 Tax=Streptomyces sp. NPDC048604 TaxID=3365578 RepID=UPI003710B820
MTSGFTRRWRRAGGVLSVLVAGTLTAGALAGCSTGDDTDAKPPAMESVGARVAAEPLLRWRGKWVTWRNVSVDLRAMGTGDILGKVTVEGHTAEVLHVGGGPTLLRGNVDYWRSALGTGSDTESRQFAGAWVELGGGRLWGVDLEDLAPGTLGPRLRDGFPGQASETQGGEGAVSSGGSADTPASPGPPVPGGGAAAAGSGEAMSTGAAGSTPSPWAPATNEAYGLRPPEGVEQDAVRYELPSGRGLGRFWVAARPPHRLLAYTGQDIPGDPEAGPSNVSLTMSPAGAREAKRTYAEMIARLRALPARLRIDYEGPGFLLYDIERAVGCGGACPGAADLSLSVRNTSPRLTGSASARLELYGSSRPFGRERLVGRCVVQLPILPPGGRASRTCRVSSTEIGAVLKEAAADGTLVMWRTSEDLHYGNVSGPSDSAALTETLTAHADAAGW